MVASFSSYPSTSSPHKPRLLWRGALHLQDGTALPGVAFISHVQPCFLSQSMTETSKGVEKSPLSPSLSVSESAPKDPSSSTLFSSTSSPPLTLAKEQQDALSLSIEMVRHAPINLVEVVEGVERDEEGTMVKPRRMISINSREKGDHVRVTYEAAGGIRMYVDPAYPSTVAYFERIFCYDDNDEEGDEERRDEGEEDGGESEERASISNVVVLSLDKSYRYSLNPTPDSSDDVFSDRSAPALPTIKSSASNGAIEAVLIGVKKRGGELGRTVELHVGQKVIRKSPRQQLASSSSSSASSSLTPNGQGSLEQRRLPAFTGGMRPDDPAPRGLSRVLTAKYRSMPPQAVHRQPLSSSSSSFPSPSSPFLPPAQPSSSRVAPPGGLKKRLSTLSDSSRSSSMPTLMKRESSSDSKSQGGDKRSKYVDRQGVVENPAGDEVGLGSDYQKVEERNRSVIKKLVHHQLLGKGVEKNDEDYLSCFNPTCNGTVLALKRQFKTELIDRVQAASIIERHLDMYL